MVMLNPLVAQRAPKVGRVMRRPTHQWNVRARPWTMQPCMIAPVIPGESLKNAVLQARVVTDPIKNRLIGWWHEYYFYYVPFRALTGIADELTAMVVNPEWTPDAITSDVAVPNHYFAGRNSIDYLAHCMDVIVAYDFRAPEETALRKADGLHLIDINRKSLFHSVIADSKVAEWDVEVADLDGDGKLEASEVDVAMEQYELLRANGLIEMTYEDYLKTYGIRGKAVQKPEDQFTPELIRYIRDWQYPSNTINPATGAAASAVSWSIAERIDKDRFFKEPGFIVGFTVTRPKVYLGNQVQYGGTMLDTIRAWLPKVMENDPYTSLKQFLAGEGPMLTGFADTAPALSDATPTQAYWIDVRDLFLHGDQFINHAAGHQVPLPAKDGNVNYITDLDAMSDMLFVDQTTKQHTEQDGMLSMVIAGSQRDYTVDSRAQTVV